MKILKKFALFLAAVMSFAPVVPAMAQAVTLSDSSTATSVVVTREVTGVKNPVTATFGYSLAESKNNPAVIGGLATGFDISFNSVMPNAEKVASVDYNLDLSSLTFTKVGDYVITLKEVSSSDDANYPVDTSDEYEILISVRNQLDDDGYPTGDLTVTLIPQVVNKDGDKTDVALFNSRADRTFIELEKYVSGDNADLGEYFKFRIDFTNATEGDVFTISVLNETYSYEVDRIRVVKPTELSELRIIPGQDLCTLVTCTPYGVNTHRLLVRGHRVANAQGNAKVTADAMQLEAAFVAPFLMAPMILVLLIILFVEPGKK